MCWRQLKTKVGRVHHFFAMVGSRAKQTVQPRQAGRWRIARAARCWDSQPVGQTATTNSTIPRGFKQPNCNSKNHIIWSKSGIAEAVVLAAQPMADSHSGGDCCKTDGRGLTVKAIVGRAQQIAILNGAYQYEMRGNPIINSQNGRAGQTIRW